MAAIKETAKSTNGGRSYLLRGLWACRLAAGLDPAPTRGGYRQEVRRPWGSSNAGDRGAYPRTIVRMCECLGVAPEDLLSGDSPGEPKETC